MFGRFALKSRISIPRNEAHWPFQPSARLIYRGEQDAYANHGAASSPSILTQRPYY